MHRYVLVFMYHLLLLAHQIIFDLLGWKNASELLDKICKNSGHSDTELLFEQFEVWHMPVGSFDWIMNSREALDFRLLLYVVVVEFRTENLF